MNEPLKELIASALELMNLSFVPPGNAASARLEFYHQFRKLWDRGIPVGMGLGHLLIRVEGAFLVIERIGEKGIAGEQLALIAFDMKEELKSHPGEYRFRIGVEHVGNRWQIANAG